MPEDRDFIRRAAAELDRVMAKPFIPIHVSHQKPAHLKKIGSSPVIFEVKRKRKLPTKANVKKNGK